MTSFVVDASVAVRWLTFEEQSEEAELLLRSGNRMIAPLIVMTEVANALTRKVSVGQMSVYDARRQLIGLRHYFDELVSFDDLIDGALSNACRFRHPIYDLIYLELAHLRNLPFVTADRRLKTKLIASDLSRYVTLLSDWRPE